MPKKTRKPRRAKTEEHARWKIKKDDLRQILAQHRKWVESEGKEGKRADLRGTCLAQANLQKVSLSEANLQWADLSGAKLQEARLVRANLEGADLSNAKLQGAYLSIANLRGAALPEANLQEAHLFQANLQGAGLSIANLRGAVLSGADLQGAYLFQANLEGADLSNANLQGADLAETNLSKANLLSAKLAEAILQDATLTGATGVQAWQFAGADLTGATFGESPLDFEQPLRVVEEASKNARKIFISVLVGCAYSVLTLATTSGAGGSGNNSIALPILQTSVPTVWFYRGAPVVLLSMFVYFHLYLQNLWEALADLPAVFPDGRPADKKVYPWLLNGLVRFHFKLLRNDCLPRLAFLKRLIPSLLAWWAVPLTLLAFLTQQPIADRWSWGWQLVLASGSLVLAGYFQLLARRTLRQEDAALKLWPRFRRLKNLSWLKKLSWPQTLKWFKKLIGKRRPPAAG